MAIKEEEIYVKVNGYYYEAIKRTTDGEEIVIIDRQALESIVEENKELAKETFKVEVKRYDEFYCVTVTSNKTGESVEELAYLFPKWTARKLRKQIIKNRKNKNYKKEYTI